MMSQLRWNLWCVIFSVLLVLCLSAFGSPVVISISAQDEIEGKLEFLGDTSVERTSGVWVDGGYVGYLQELKGKKAVQLLPGDHQISIRQAGYQDFNLKVTVEPGKTTPVAVKMVPATGNTWPTETAEVKVDVKPSRAAVFVDDRFLGHAGELGGRFHSMLLSPGHHRIKVELPGYRTFETDVTLVAGQKSVVKTELVKGSIKQSDTLIQPGNDSNQGK
jgi:hypothetical protein